MRAIAATRLKEKQVDLKISFITQGEEKHQAISYIMAFPT